MKCDKKIMRLYAVTDRKWTTNQTLYQQIEAALKGGITCVQLREKNLPYEDFLQEAREISTLCRKYNVPFLINDNVEIALVCNADGIHIGQEDMKTGKVRRILDTGKILGVSVQTVEDALQAEKDGADYLGVGAIFPSSTKPEAKVISKDVLRNICNTVKIPVVAIGGINKNNMLTLAGTGADGVAIVSAIFSAKDIEAECRELYHLSEKIVSV